MDIDTEETVLRFESLFLQYHDAVEKRQRMDANPLFVDLVGSIDEMTAAVDQLVTKFRTIEGDVSRMLLGQSQHTSSREHSTSGISVVSNTDAEQGDPFTALYLTSSPSPQPSAGTPEGHLSAIDRQVMEFLASSPLPHVRNSVHQLSPPTRHDRVSPSPSPARRLNHTDWSQVLDSFDGPPTGESESGDAAVPAKGIAARKLLRTERGRKMSFDFARVLHDAIESEYHCMLIDILTDLCLDILVYGEDEEEDGEGENGERRGEGEEEGERERVERRGRPRGKKKAKRTGEKKRVRVRVRRNRS